MINWDWEVKATQGTQGTNLKPNGGGGSCVTETQYDDYGVPSAQSSPPLDYVSVDSLVRASRSSPQVPAKAQAQRKEVEADRDREEEEETEQTTHPQDTHTHTHTHTHTITTIRHASLSLPLSASQDEGEGEKENHLLRAPPPNTHTHTHTHKPQNQWHALLSFFLRGRTMKKRKSSHCVGCPETHTHTHVCCSDSEHYTGGWTLPLEI